MLDYVAVTPNYIRGITFRRAEEYVIEALKLRTTLDLLIASPQESGKSWWSDELAAKLAKMGKNVLIAVPSGELARDHASRLLKNWGVESALLQSHEGIFKGHEEDCPEYDHIQFQYRLGADSKVYKSLYCKPCPFLEECPYPKQYKRAMDPAVSVVIIQHAHFTCETTLIQLFQNKKFDVLIVDESFIDTLVESIQPTEFEIASIRELGASWSKALSGWLVDGGYPKYPIYPSDDDIIPLHQKFEENNYPWRFRTFLEQYNRGTFMHSKSGMKIFHPLPFMPVRVLTDATPTLDELKTVLDNEDIRVVGSGEVIDIQALNKENQIIQIINASSSKSNLLKDELYFDYLSVIGLKCSNDLKDDRVLITTFKDKEDFKWTTEALMFFREKFPHLDVGLDPLRNRIVIDSMKVGTNMYKDFTVQFLVCSVYMNHWQLSYAAYKVRTIVNHWRDKMGQDRIQNLYPNGKIDIPYKPEPVIKIMPGGVYEFPFSHMVPEFKYERMAYDKNAGKSQQAIRIRFHENISQRKIVYILGNYSFPSLQITKVILQEDWLSELN
jgi:hypothetical protein